MNLGFKLTIIVFSFAWISKEIVLPASAAYLYSEKYMELVVACDTAMDDSWYHGDDNKKSEIAHLLDCHDYDKTRKILLISGLPKEYLSYLGLKALELYQRPAEEFAKQHRFEKR